MAGATKVIQLILDGGSLSLDVIPLSERSWRPSSLPRLARRSSTFRVAVYPWFFDEFTYDDVIEAVPTNEIDTFKFVRVLERSQSEQDDCILRSADLSDDWLRWILRRIDESGGYWERAFGGCLFAALESDSDFDMTRFRLSLHLLSGTPWQIDSHSHPDLMTQLAPNWRRPTEALICGPGWAQIVERTHRALASIDPDYRIGVIKEKWGELAYNASQFDKANPNRERLSRVIDHAEEESRQTCEWCGEHGRLRELSWDRTLCDRCVAVLVAWERTTGSNTH